MIDIVGLYDSLLNASFGGVAFYMLPADIEVGRRTLRFMFPGADQAEFQDLGADDGQINVQGFLIGGDYIAQSLQLRTAFRTPGPATLVHPWLGTMKVVQVPGTRARLSFSDQELRVCRFQASFYPYTPPPVLNADSLAGLAVAIGDVEANAQAWLAGVLAPAAAALGAFSYAQGWISSIQTQFGLLINTGGSGAEIGPAAAPAVAALSTPVTAPNAAWGVSTAALLAGVPAAIAAAATPPVPSVVAPGGVLAAATAADPGDACTMLLTAIPGLSAPLTAPSPGPALATAMLALVVAQAALAASNIDYASQQEATAQAALMYAAFDSAISAAAIAAASSPAAAAPVWRGLLDLKAAYAADVSALVGRLPAVVTIAVPNAMPAWLLAQYISGDSPSQVYATWQDIIFRNNILVPGAVPPGTIEALAS